MQPRMPDAEIASFMSAAPEALLVLDTTGIIRYANTAAQRLLRRGHDDLVGTHFGYPVSDDLREEIELRAADGTVRRAEMRVTPTLAGGEGRWIVSLHDVERAAHRQLDRPEGEAAIMVTSHELRNPMTALSGFAEVLIADWQRLDDAERLAAVRRIVRASRRVQLIVSRFLDAAVLESGLFTPVREPVELLDVLLEGLSDLAWAAADIDVRVPPGLVVSASRDHVWSVASNFVLNALRHAGAPVTVTACREGASVRLEVADEGPGVPPARADQLFERFVREPGTSHPKGSGLGLWIARSIARAYGGDAWCEANEPRGARFVCTFPAADG